MNDNKEDKRCQHYAAIFVNVIITAVIMFADGLYNHQGYHTSILSDYGWVLELLSGHLKYIHCELGVHLHVFEALVDELHKMGYTDSCNVTLKEQLSIFLYASVTGLSVHHLGKCFQCSNEIISL